MADDVTLSNARYTVLYNPSAQSIMVRETSSGKAQVFSPTYMVAFSATKPSMKLMDIQTDAENISFKVCGYNNSLSLFDAKAAFTTLNPDSVTATDSTIVFFYPEQTDYQFSVTLTCPQGNEDIVLTSKLVNKSKGWFSVGYYGANEMDISEVKELFQPHVFTGLRAPHGSYLTPAFMCTLPGTFLQVGNMTYGVYADPKELPFAPLPVTLARSPFGVALRNKAGTGKELKPMVWAPILSNTGSQLSSTYKTLEFSIRLYVSGRPLRRAYEDVACREFGFGDYRHNDLGTLNETLDRLVDYAMSTEWDVWKPEMKGSSYETDVPGSVKNVSAMPAWVTSLIRDDQTIFDERAEPLTEFMLSRKKSNFSPEPTPGVGGQVAVPDLGTPCMLVSEMLSLYCMFGRKMGTMMHYSDLLVGTTVGSHENYLRKSFSYYRATGADVYRTNMTEGANKYIQEEITTLPTDFSFKNNSNSSFWCQLAPKFVELYEVYRLTGDSAYLKAAYEGARMYTLNLWMIPAVRQGDSTLCNKNNKAPLYRSGTAISIPEEYAPNWRLSEQGMQSECSQTSYGGHRGVFTANYGPLMLRIGAQMQDSFLMNIGKATVIGRYRNFPGYHINTDRTTVYEKADFPFRPFSLLNCCTSVHHNHLWPQIGMVYDYLVSDVAVKTHGEVDFPAYYVQNIVHMANRAYYTDGTYYGEDGLTLYMPKNLITTSNQELNYIAARGNGKLYLVFTNQSAEPVRSTITINGLDVNGKAYTIRRDNQLAGGGSVSGNQLMMDVSPHGVTAVAIENIKIETHWQHLFEANTNANKWNTYVMENIETANSKAMLINPSDSVTRLFIYSQNGRLSAPFEVRYSLDHGAWQQMQDTVFPYECTIAVDAANRVDFQIVVADTISDILYFERVMPSATIRGWNSVRRQEGVDLTITVNDAVAPYEATLSDGASTIMVEESKTPFVTHQSPLFDTRYTLSSVLDSRQVAATVSGDAKVMVLDAYETVAQFPISADSYVFSTQKNANYGTKTTMEMKGVPSSSKQIYLRATMPKVTLEEQESLRLGLYMSATQRLLDESPWVRVVLHVGAMEWEEATITFANQPSMAEEMYTDTIGISNKTPTGGYVYWNITPLTELYKEGDRVDMHIEWLDGAETANLTFSSREDTMTPPYLMVMKPITTALTGTRAEHKLVTESYYDMLGRPVSAAAEGVKIGQYRNEQGQIEYHKIIIQ